MTRKRRLAWGLLTFIAVYSLAWFVTASIVEHKLLAILQADEGNGFHVIIGGHRKGGFPLEIHLVLHDVTATDPNGVALSAPRLDLGAALLRELQIPVTAPAGLTVIIPRGQDRGRVEIKIGDLDGTADLTSAGLRGIAFTADNTSIIGLLPDGAVSIGTLIVNAGPPLATDSASGARVMANALQIHLPSPDIAALGNEIRRLTFNANLTGQLPHLTAQSLAQWRDNGGTVELHELSADWGPLGLGMGGTMALDNNFQPTGAFSAKVTGFSQIIEALEAAGWIKPGRGALMNVALGLIAKPEGEQHIPTLEAPLTIQDQTVYLGPVKLCAMPRLDLY